MAILIGSYQNLTPASTSAFGGHKGGELVGKHVCMSGTLGALLSWGFQASRAILFSCLNISQELLDRAGEDHGVERGCFTREQSHAEGEGALPSPWQAAHPSPWLRPGPPELHPAGLLSSQDLIISLRETDSLNILLCKYSLFLQ